MPTISPLCPPGSAAAKNGIKGPAAPVRNDNGTGPEPTKQVVPISQPLKATTTAPPEMKEEAKPQETPKEENPPITENSSSAENPGPEKPPVEKSELDKSVPAVGKAASDKTIIEIPSM